MKNPIVIDPPGFDQRGAWQKCSDYVDKCGGMVHDDGEVNWLAAFGAAPGVCSCPACGEMYWMWGRVQRCVVCAFEYPSDAWPMYSYGIQAYRTLNGKLKYGGDPEAYHRVVAYYQRKQERDMQHPYYRYGFEHPHGGDIWWHYHQIDWKFVISNPGADMYTVSERVSKQLQHTFTYYSPEGNQPQRYQRIRDEAGKLAHLIACSTPESREQSLALTKLEEAIFFANASIARNEKWDGGTMLEPLQLTVEVETRRGKPVKHD